MAVGDIKGQNAIVIPLIAGAAVVKGQVVDMQADTFFDPSADGATGKFAVAIADASGTGVEFRAVIFGEVEVAASAVAIPAGVTVMAAPTGLVAAADAPAVVAETVGTTMEAFVSGGNGTIFVGLVN